MTEKNRAVAYVRVSTKHESQKESPEHQRAAIEAYARELGLDIINTYEDRDTATSIVARPEVQKMVADAQKGLFDVIIFSSLSRFSRDALDSISLKRMLVNALGIRLISIEDLYDSAKDDNEMLFGIVSVVNQKLSEQIGIASRRGIRQSALKGNFIGSLPPYGYRKVNINGRKTLEIDPEKAKIVRLIFDMYVNQKMGEKEIVKYLNERGVPAPKGGTWGITSVQYILQNEAYTGANVFCKHTVVKVYDDISDMHNRRRKLVQRDKSEWERSPFKTHEAIIDEETFRKAQEIRLIRGGGSRGGRKKYKNVFAKMIFCKHCGSAMVSALSKGGERYRYLICSRRRRHGDAGCKNNKWIPYYAFRDELIAMLVDKLSKLIDSEVLAEEVAKGVTIDEYDYEKEINQVKRRIEDNRKLLFEIRRQHMLGEIDQAQYNFEREQYEQEIGKLEKQLDELEQKKNEVADREKLKQEIKEAIDELTLIESYDDTEKTRLILSKLIERITVDVNGNIDVYTPLGKVL